MNSRTDMSSSHSFGSAQSGSPPTLWRAFAGFGLWAICFTVLYTAHALACTWITGPSGDVNALLTQTGRVTWLLVAIWMFFVLWLIVLSLRSGVRVLAVRRLMLANLGETQSGDTPAADFRLQNPESGGSTQVQRRSLWFMVRLTFVVDISSVVITVISGFPVILTPACL